MKFWYICRDNAFILFQRKFVNILLSISSNIILGTQKNLLIEHLQHTFWLRNKKMWYVRPTKSQTSLCIPAVCSEYLLVAWSFQA